MNSNEKESLCNVYCEVDTIITLEESMNIINKQEQEITRLKTELDSVKTERDLLACEVSKLKFERDIADLKRMYTKRSDNRKSTLNNVNGSINNSLLECDDSNFNNEDEEINDDIDDIEDDLISNYKAVNISHPYKYEWHGVANNSSVHNTSAEVINYSRTMNSYELSQDLLEKQIELLERKYGGEKAREAAIIIQKAFRRYMLIKKFTHITAMAKAEKRLSRRFPVESISNISNNNNNSGNVQQQEIMTACDMKNSLQGNVTPIRSLSMREKRLGELENNTNSLPRTYACRYKDYTYCCGVAEGTYSPCCLSATPINSCASAVVKNYSNSSELMRNYQLSRNVYYQIPLCQRKYNGHYVCHNPSQYQISSPVSLMSTPARKVPPEVPKRTSSISLKSNDSSQCLLSSSDISFNKTNYSSSLSSVQSSGSDSSSAMNTSHTSLLNVPHYASLTSWNKKPQVTETVRKRQYRVGLNLFNKKPEKGISYLMRKGFLDTSPQAVAKFLIARKGVSKQMIGEYLGNVQNQFNNAVLECFVNEIDLSGMQIDVALRKYQTYFRMPGEAQKIERLMEVFSHRYCQCNRDVVSRFRSLDTVFVLAFATVMLNTDLHSPNLKPDKKIKLEEFIKNLRGIDDCCDLDRDLLVGIYERIKANEFKPGNDHVSQVMKVQSTIVGKKLMLALPHRRLVCYCRLYEVLDVNKKERSGVHQREVFLFNDLLVITKILSKKKNSVTYTFRQSFSLSGLQATTFQAPYYQYGIQLVQRVDNQVLITFNARNDHDRAKFVEDIRESIFEMDEMENLRIESELERQKSNRTTRSNSIENRDSGVADVEVCQCLHACPQSMKNNNHVIQHSSDESVVLKRSGLSNSLLDIHDQG